MSDTPDRIEWAVKLLNVQPDDRILEIGCGSGAAVPLVCRRLTTGSITAIDRSGKMAKLARDRNRSLISAGKALVEHCDLLAAKLPPASFNKIFLFNLNVFWMDPVAELDEIRRLLMPDGIFFIFHNPPPGAELTEYAEAIARNLEKNHFRTGEPVLDIGVASLCISSRPAI